MSTGATEHPEENRPDNSEESETSEPAPEEPQTVERAASPTKAGDRGGVDSSTSRHADLASSEMMKLAYDRRTVLLSGAVGIASALGVVGLTSWLNRLAAEQAAKDAAREDERRSREEFLRSQGQGVYVKFITDIETFRSDIEAYIAARETGTAVADDDPLARTLERDFTTAFQDLANLAVLGTDNAGTAATKAVTATVAYANAARDAYPKPGSPALPEDERIMRLDALDSAALGSFGAVDGFLKVAKKDLDIG